MKKCSGFKSGDLVAPLLNAGSKNTPFLTMSGQLAVKASPKLPLILTPPSMNIHGNLFSSLANHDREYGLVVRIFKKKEKYRNQ
jgi:hypothetical protein